MALERLRATQEGHTELLRSKDACIAFAAGGALGALAAAGLGALWLRNHSVKRRRAAVFPTGKVPGLLGVLDLGVPWDDVHLAVCLLCSAEVCCEFLMQGVDTWLCEAGLGGRLSAVPNDREEDRSGVGCKRGLVRPLARVTETSALRLSV